MEVTRAVHGGGQFFALPRKSQTSGPSATISIFIGVGEVGVEITRAADVDCQITFDDFQVEVARTTIARNFCIADFETTRVEIT